MAIKEIQIGEFKGGLNTRDGAGELARDEIPDALNVTIDERGSAQKRLGYERRFVPALGAGLVSNLFYWGTRGFLVTQEGPRMHIDGATTAFLTWTTSDRCGMTEINSNLVLIHPVDGVRVYDGTTVTGPFANAPLGNTAATWQGKVWLAGNPTQPSRITYSAIGDPATYSVNSWVDLKEKDSSKVTCLAGASGLDISGRPGLLAFKEDSAYRIYDSTTGAYNTIDAAVGCGSSVGAISAYGRTYVASTRGIYYTDGTNPMLEASTKIENLFHKDLINQTRADLYAAGRYQDRLWFSFPAVGATANSIAIEIHPLSDWTMAHTNAASCYASLGRGATDLVMGSPSVVGRVYNSHRTGSDDGVAIASYLQTYWTEPNFGNLMRIRRARFTGLGAFNAALYKNYESGQSLRNLPVSITPTSAVYDAPTSIYDAPGVVYGPSAFQAQQDFWSIGTARAFSIRISETSTASLFGRSVIGQAAPVIGAWTLAHINLMTIDLGIR